MKHQPMVMFRRHDNGLQWQCGVCGYLFASEDGLKEAVRTGGLDGCPGYSLQPELLQVPHQLGYVVREAWRDWATRQPDPKPHWLVPYEQLAPPDQQADQEIGTAMVRWVIATLQGWCRVEFSEGLVCQRLGVDRLTWRDTRNSLGLQQEEATKPPAKVEAGSLEGVFASIAQERAAQDEKWGGPDHDDSHNWSDWVGFMREHLDRCLEAPASLIYERQLIRVAALAVAAIQAIRRRRARAILARYEDPFDERR